ncbi:KpsF/GutQ family sugar-phosphate isomerase [Azospirillum brasilense]|uniref:KpsF/GutQ family sugar-phosphate isomerase n=1 Tax=Azospirillum brasilense TaxID=192 RepID=UPI000E6A1DF7|nr:KpsF/GutQ family sugar-phosphate isomerase [Azospirillum brasilense]NUB28211.1 KpsF/GutQ family sugar-phosphate isomerase [Azospirillum brasilense]NUB35512.1 KpsF/GutQ family sugar-phosphate isomerase [Azospirillum brasilense]RIV97295.1 KpsF/GutQ family sugar-phosphate isomerase [Azospirillum brasilense]
MDIKVLDRPEAGKVVRNELDGIEDARQVLLSEAEALTTLASSLGTPFANALKLLAPIQGRVVATGMGKSGHVARKIAATLASTGTPAFFVHPGEASHGDLGMVTGKDAVIALSNSGETSELGDIVTYSRRQSIPLIGITSRATSTLAKVADVALVLPTVSEACPHGLAPTTSTTMMLALGDALAVALLKHRGFSVADFATFHPGGSLGRKLLRVGDVMHGEEALPLVSGDTPMGEAILVMTAKTFGCVGVVDSNRRLVGVITDGDLRRHMNPKLMTAKSADIMTSAPRTMHVGALLADALGFINRQAITSIFVEDDGRIVGILHVHDCLRAGVS